MTVQRRFVTAIAIGVLTIAVTACAPTVPAGVATDLDRTPRPVGTPAPDHGDAALALPQLSDDARVLDPGWDAPPQEADGVYLAPRNEKDRLVFTAVSEEGSVLWTAERPMLCSAFVVAASDDGPIAILMDITAGHDTVAETTVSAYDLRTGVERWGPVHVPGPHVGPGLVFAAPPPDSMGDSGPRIAIDSATGTTLADEATEAGLTILGEHDGITLLADDTHLFARTADESELWALPLNALDLPADAQLSGADLITDEGIALLGDRDDGGVLVDLGTGTVIAHGVHGTAIDRSTGTRIVLDNALRAYDSTGNTVWSREIPTDASLLSAGYGVVYVRTNDGIHVFDTAFGEALSSLPSDTDVPKQITETGTGIIGSYEQPFLLIRDQ